MKSKNAHYVSHGTNVARQLNKIHTAEIQTGNTVVTKW